MKKLLGEKWLAKIEKFLPLGIVILGALVRVICLGSVPGGSFQDEAFVAWNAYGLWTDGMDSAGNHFPVYMADWGDGHSALYCWLLVPLYALVGKAGITRFVIRLPQVLIGTLTLVAVYFLFKKMFGRKAGLWALFMLAVCPWHITMCRWALDANLAPAFLIFGLVFFIKGLENKKFLLISAILYGLSLYCYAVIWPIVPLMLLLQIIYGLYHKKLSINRWSILSTVVLGIMALPLLLFLVVNSTGNQINLPFMTIPVMGSYRANDLAITIPELWSNFRRVITLLARQNIGLAHDILLPHGLFYDIGRVFIIIGFVALVVNMVRKLIKKEFSYEVFVFIQLIGAGVVCCLVYVYLHQVNCLYIPLVLCEAYGIFTVLELLAKKSKGLQRGGATVVILAYLVCFVWFEIDYYTDYKEIVKITYAEDTDKAVLYAMEQGDEIIAEMGVQWPRILLYSQTTPKQYLASVEYSNYPVPAHFSDGENTFYMGIDFENIQSDKVYICYFADVHYFEDFDLTPFGLWYVAVPKE